MKVFKSRVSQRTINLITVFLALTLIVAFYFWTALTNGFGIVTETMIHYPLLGRAFLEGQLHLDIEPSPQLLALPDPYDSNANALLRLHDASLYHGEYYLYFGATPAVLLFAPYRFLSGHDCPQIIAVPLFCSAGLIFSTVLFLRLVRDYFPKVPLWMKLAAIVSLGMANTCPFLIRRPDVYEVAISCAYALLQLAFLFFYYALRQPARAVPALVLASTCLGASVGARYNYVFIVFVFASALIGMLWKNQLRVERKAWSFLVIFSPLILIGLLMAWYNYARFDNPFEFGQRYQLAAIQMHATPLLRLSNVPYNLWFYFFAPPYVTAKFPFIEAFPFVWFKRPDYYFSLEKIAGLFLISPISLFALTLPALIRKSTGMEDRPLIFTLLFMAASSLVTLAPILFFSGATMRYFVDFAPTLIFLGCIMVCYFHASIATKPSVTSWILQIAILIVAFLGIWNGLLLSFTGYYDYLQLYNPATYAFLERIFQPVEIVTQALAGLFDW